MLLDDLPTPCLLIEHNRLEQNLLRMQNRAQVHGVKLRPHTKTHKSVWLARRQRQRGAQGLTVAKVGEAEVFVDAGFDDVRVAYPVVGRDKHKRLLRLMQQVRCSFCIDTLDGARAASDFYEAQGVVAKVLLEIDSGHGRTGVRWDSREAVALAQHITDLPGLQLVGILTHEGQAYHGPQEDETPEQALRRVAAEARDRMLDVAVRLREAGIPGVEPGSFQISIGSTPSMSHFENAERDGFRITEIRPGNYVFNDAMQVGLGSATLEDCALTVLTTVISKHRERSGREPFFLDAGKKTITSDTGYGTNGYGILLYNAAAMRRMPHARITGLSEEHGWGTVPGGASFAVGDRVRFIPNHACVAVHTQDHLYLVDGDEVVEKISVDARGRSQ